MSVGGKAAHVDADLGDDRPRAKVLDTWDQGHLPDGGALGRRPPSPYVRLRQKGVICVIFPMKDFL